MGAIAAFGVRQTGQLDQANADKLATANTLDACDTAWRAAIGAK